MAGYTSVENKKFNQGKKRLQNLFEVVVFQVF